MAPYSVLMSVYAGEKAENFRLAAQSMLEQTVPPAEFVLACDGPLPPELDKVVEKLVLDWPEIMKVLRLPERRGLGEALREGVLACRCEYVARMDSDDLALPERMALQLTRLEEDPDLAALGGQIEEFSRENLGRREVPLSTAEVRRRAAFRNPMNHMTVTFRRQAVLEAGNYMAFDRFEDYHLWVRMLGRGQRLANLPQVLVRARVNEDTYARRGGLAYFRQSVAMQSHLRACGLCTRLGWLRNCLVRFGGTVLLPARARSWLYQSFLRKERAR